ncbi:MAG: tetratricopeptide repeat protein [Flavobacteriaceae bacterium]|nr:tetratricopeptide repeat protein [Flavobacteriaceae bacterium]
MNIRIIFLCFFLFHFSWLSGQKQTDSLFYHYNKRQQPTHSDDLLNAYVYFEGRRSEAESRQDTSAMVYHLHLITIIQLDLGMLYESEQSAVTILSLLDASPKTPATADDYRRTYNHLGRLYRQLQNPTQSIDYYEKALSYTTTKTDSLILLNNMGVIYKDQKNWDEARRFYELAYSKSIPPTDTLHYARVLNNLYYVAALNGQPTAIDSMKKAKELRLEHNDNIGLYSSYRDLATVSKRSGNGEAAQMYASEALELAHRINSLTYLKDAYALLIELGDEPELLNYKAVTDSIESLRLKQQNSYASLKYNVAKERERTLAIQLEQERERAQKQRYQAVALLLVLIAIFLFYYLRQRFRKAREVEIYNTETRISKKVHDEVANDVYRVMTLLQDSETDTAPILDDLEAIYIKTRDISRENTFIDLNEQFAETLNDLMLVYTNAHCSVITKGSQDIDWEQINDDKKRAVYRILQELLTNMKKHSKATLVVIDFKQFGKKISVEYRDNGAGSSLHKKNGLQNAENRIFVLNGTITFETEPGSGFKARFTL